MGRSRDYRAFRGDSRVRTNVTEAKRRQRERERERERERASCFVTNASPLARTESLSELKRFRVDRNTRDRNISRRCLRPRGEQTVRRNVNVIPDEIPPRGQVLCRNLNYFRLTVRGRYLPYACPRRRSRSSARRVNSTRDLRCSFHTGSHNIEEIIKSNCTVKDAPRARSSVSVSAERSTPREQSRDSLAECRN